jgi:hypothetical protein
MSSADVSCARRNGAQEHQLVLPAGSMELVRKHQNQQPFFQKKKNIAERWKNEFVLSPALIMTSQEKVKFAL